MYILTDRLFSVLRIKNDTPHDIHTRTLYVDERRSKNGDSTVNSLNGKHLTRAPRSDTSSTRPKIGSQRNINVSVGLMFVINDLIQSIGVLVSAYIIKFKVSNCATCMQVSTYTAHLLVSKLYKYMYTCRFQSCLFAKSLIRKRSSRFPKTTLYYLLV